MIKCISIMANSSTKEKDLVTVEIIDLPTGKNKVRFNCHIVSI